MSRLLAVQFLIVLAFAEPTTPAIELVPGVHLLPGRFVSGSQPDGNTVIFTAPDGLIVVDTGRHPEHTRGIVDFATQAQSAVRVIVNSHWHLDHIGGNPNLRRAFPGARVYASGALADAQKGFLAAYRADLEAEIKKNEDPEAQRPWRAEIAIIDAGSALAPDEIIATSGPRSLAGRTLDLELETHAVTAGDVWVFDAKTKVLAAGDLVTLPAPFFDTACPERWKAALDRLAHEDFALLVPGHGAPMHRKEFEVYRAAFGELLTCAASTRLKQECIDAWLQGAGALIGKDEPPLARSLMDYYMDAHLRGDPAAAAKLCGS